MENAPLVGGLTCPRFVWAPPIVVKAKAAASTQSNAASAWPGARQAMGSLSGSAAIEERKALATYGKPIVPQIGRYQAPEGIVTSSRTIQAARPEAGIGCYQAEETRLRAQMQRAEAHVERFWETDSVFSIAVTAQDMVGVKLTPRQVWGIKQRLDVAKREAQKE